MSSPDQERGTTPLLTFDRITSPTTPISLDSNDSTETLRQLKRSVGYLGFCFMIMFCAFNSTQNLIQSLYKQLGYEHLGITSLFSLYASFSVSSLVVKGIITRFSYKQLFIGSVICYSTFILCGIYASVCGKLPQGSSGCSENTIYLIVILCSMLCGSGSAIIWITQGGYMDAICQQVSGSKGSLCGIFWSIRQLSHIFGNLSAILILSQTSENVNFFVIMSVFMVIAAMMFTQILEVPQPNRVHVSNLPPIKQQVSSVFSLIGSSRFLPLFFLVVVGGLNPAMSMGFMRSLVESSIDGDEHEVSIKLSYVLICFGCFEYVGGKVSGYLADRYSSYHLATAGVLLFLFGIILGLVGLQAKSYTICFVISSIQGFCDCYNSNIIQVISNADYTGKLEVFQAIRFTGSISISVTHFTILLFSNSPKFYFLTVAAVVALVSVFVVSLFPHFSTESKKKEES